MEILKIIGITFIIVVPMILICAFLNEKSKNFMDKLNGKNSNSNNDHK